MDNRTESQILDDIRVSLGIINRSETGGQWRRLISARTRDACLYCGASGKHWTIEHLVPRSRGGRSEIENLARACRGCNQRRGNDPEIVKYLRVSDMRCLEIAQAAERKIQELAKDRNAETLRRIGYPRILKDRTITSIKNVKSRISPAGPYPVTALNP